MKTENERNKFNIVIDLFNTNNLILKISTKGSRQKRTTTAITSRRRRRRRRRRLKKKHH